jgi:MATE family multidrug resistance protein
MSERPSYQLTRHPVGSIFEVWALSWPLMLAYFSTGLMFFVDRLVLGRTSVAAMNAATNAGSSFWGVLIVPVVLAATAEVFVGKYHGEGALSKTARPTWQVIWFSLACAPIFVCAAPYLADYLFATTGNNTNESAYFIPLCTCAPLIIASMGFSGFFTGIGKTIHVTVSNVLSNVVNIALAIYFVLYLGWGCRGAALAGVLAQAVQITYYASIFFSRKYRQEYATGNCAFSREECKPFISVGGPSAISKQIEMLAHMTFLQIMAHSGLSNMTALTLTWNILLLVGFLIDAVSKGATAVISNVVGAKREEYIPKVLWAGIKLHIVLTCVLALVLFPFARQFVGLYLSPDAKAQLDLALIYAMVEKSMIWFIIFYFFDGCSWIIFGYFAAKSDTKFAMYVNAILNWAAYVGPIWIAVHYFGAGSNTAWMILAFYNVLIFACYFARYRVKSKAAESMPVASV